MHLVWKAIKTYIVYQKVPDASEYKGRSGAMNFHFNDPYRFEKPIPRRKVINVQNSAL